MTQHLTQRELQENGKNAIVDDNTVIFADGTRHRFVGASATELVLSPIFLKFYLICILIFIFLHQRSDLTNFGHWERIATYLGLTVAAIVWLLFSIGIAILLHRWGVIRSVYTPLISVPTIAFSEMSIHVMKMSVFQVLPGQSTVPLEYIIQAMVVVVLMDTLFGNFVAVQHPCFVKLDKSSPPTDAAPATPSTSAPERPNTAVAMPQTEIAPAPVADTVPDPETPASDTSPDVGKMLILNGKEIPAHEVLVMRIEDHYLRIETTKTNVLLRNKISAAVEMMDPDIGVQVNRSVWVSRSAIKTVYRTPSYGAEVALKNGNEFSVSRSRIAGVLDCLKRWDIDVVRRD